MKTYVLISCALFASLSGLAQKPWSIGLEAGHQFYFRSLRQESGALLFQNSPIRLQRIGFKILLNPNSKSSWETGLYKLGPSLGASYYPSASIPVKNYYSIVPPNRYLTTGGVPLPYFSNVSIRGPLWSVPLLWRHALINEDGIAFHIRAGVQTTWNLSERKRSARYRDRYRSHLHGDTTFFDLQAQSEITAPRLHLSAQLGVEGTFRLSKRWYGFGNLTFNYGLHEKQRAVTRYTYNQDPERVAEYRSRGTGYQWGLGLRYQFR